MGKALEMARELVKILEEQENSQYCEKANCANKVELSSLNPGKHSILEKTILSYLNNRKVKLLLFQKDLWQKILCSIKIQEITIHQT